jgi:hypothetical protein
VCVCAVCAGVVDEILETGKLQRLESLKADPRKRAIKELCEVSTSDYTSVATSALQYAQP